MSQEANRNQIKKRFAELIEPERVVNQPESMKQYTKDYSFSSGVDPLLAAFPGSLEDVQAIVKLANEEKIPLIPISSGPPHFRGDTIPEKAGIIVNFSRMKRIIKIDSVNRSVWIEPGVTFGELMPEIKKHGLKLDTPFLPRSSKSVVTSRLEREPVIMPKYQYDYIDPLLTLEVVYGKGELFRTGSASGPGSLDTLKSDKVNPWGPGSIDYFRFISGAQGTMGLVTWALTKTEVLPTIQKLYFFPFDDVKKMTDLINQLLRKRVVDECLALNNINLATILAKDISDEYNELKKNLPPWTLMVCISGYKWRPEERIDIMETYLNEISENLEVKSSLTLDGAEGKEKMIFELLSNPWLKEPYWKLRPKGACHDIYFLSPLSKMHEFINIMNNVLAKNNHSEDDIGCYIQPMVQGRGCHCEFNLFCDESDANERDKTRQLFMDGSETLMKNGAFFSRPYGPWADMVYDKNGQEVIALKKLKDIFDPNNVLNPGKLCF